MTRLPDRVARRHPACAAHCERSCEFETKTWLPHRGTTNRLLALALLSLLSALIFLRSRVEQLLVICHAEVVRLALVNRSRRCGPVDIHIAYCTQRMRVGRYACFGVHLIRAWIQPALSLVLHLVSCLLGYILAVITLYHAQCEIDARRQSPCRGNVPLLNESGAAFQRDVWELHRHAFVRIVIRGCRLALQQARIRQQKCARTN